MVGEHAQLHRNHIYNNSVARGVDLLVGPGARSTAESSTTTTTEGQPVDTTTARGTMGGTKAVGEVVQEQPGEPGGRGHQLEWDAGDQRDV